MFAVLGSLLCVLVIVSCSWYRSCSLFVLMGVFFFVVIVRRPYSLFLLLVAARVRVRCSLLLSRCSLFVVLVRCSCYCSYYCSFVFFSVLVHVLAVRV